MRNDVQVIIKVASPRTHAPALTQFVPYEALECRIDSVDLERLSSDDAPHEHHP